MDRPSVSPSEQVERKPCRCPFCEYSMEMPFPFCQACGVELRYCPVCGEPLPKESDVCSHCAEGA